MPAKKSMAQSAPTGKKVASPTTTAGKAGDSTASATVASSASAASAASSAEKIVISDPTSVKKPSKASRASTTSKKPAKKSATPRSTASKRTSSGGGATTRKVASGQKKTAAASETKVIANIDVGFGNSLFIRGEGAELSWEKGIPMENAGSGEWYWSTKASSDLVFKFLINDEIWCQGDNLTMVSGATFEATPFF